MRPPAIAQSTLDDAYEIASRWNFEHDFYARTFGTPISSSSSSPKNEHLWVVVLVVVSLKTMGKNEVIKV